MNGNFKIGHSLNTSHGFVTVADYAKEIGANFFQIFLTSPQNYNQKRHSENEFLSLNNKLKEYRMSIVIHSSYLLNFCNPPESNIHKLAIKLLCQDLKESKKLDAIGVVIHMGKYLKLEVNEAINNYIKGIKEVLSKTPKDSIIIFETGAGQGTEICTSIFELGKLYRKFNKN